ncbi:hypothetical protein ISG33_14310 [Glaciecola sp. MH2013]|uniref:hypothetical protein n=1 Tax=Glaciecola sp. MH2013 TaxID=2785524 RepID=UPI00189F8117|nr:hypothetical protein [Glaciecola sp. MH2013]MBF7074575.1 hypothetical protein [Glaciecola sp. MH2013]
MKIILSLLLLLPFLAYACGDGKTSELTPFAKVDHTVEQNGQSFYEVFIPSKHSEYFLTSLDLSLPSSLLVELDVIRAFGYGGFDSVSFFLNPELLDVIKLTALYSSNEDRTEFVLCGKAIELNLKGMLLADQPEMIIPPPPSLD